MPSVEFIHGTIKASTLRAVLTDAKSILIISAYTTSAGLEAVRDLILACTKRGGTATLLLGIDRGGVTSAALIYELAAMQESAGVGLEIFVVVENRHSFLHAKVFAAWKARSAEVLIGSFNLTGSGLAANHELAAHISSSSNSFFDDLARFVDSIPAKRRLTAENAKAVAGILGQGNGVSESPEAVARRRELARERLQTLLAVLHIDSGKMLPPSQVSSYRANLQESGAFWTYEFDLERLTIPSGLAFFYERGLLLKEKTGRAGTARMRLPTAVSASFSLVPTVRQRMFSSLAKRLGKAFRACGFETPYGWWIPNVYLDDLRSKAQSIDAAIRADSQLAVEVRRHVDEHKAKLQQTVEAVLQFAVENGIEHPDRWSDVRDVALTSIKARYEGSPEAEWIRSPGHTEAREYLRSRLLQVEGKLDADLAIAKLQRIRPELLHVPVDIDDKVVIRLLECMTWAVVEDRGERNTKRAVRALSEHRKGAAIDLKSLTQLSKLLLEGAETGESMFFTVFGPPPYWAVENDWQSGDGEE